MLLLYTVVISWIFRMKEMGTAQTLLRAVGEAAQYSPADIRVKASSSMFCSLETPFPTAILAELSLPGSPPPPHTCLLRHAPKNHSW